MDWCVFAEDEQRISAAMTAAGGAVSAVLSVVLASSWLWCCLSPPHRAERPGQCVTCRNAPAAFAAVLQSGQPARCQQPVHAAARRAVVVPTAATAPGNLQGGGADAGAEQRHRIWMESYGTQSRTDAQLTFPGDRRKTYGGVAGAGVTIAPARPSASPSIRAGPTST
jgi:hypothetical protein